MFTEGNKMQGANRDAFTMIELIYVIVIIGILSAVAVPKFTETMKLSHDTKGKTTLASVRSALVTERQKRILRGDFTAIDDLSNGGTGVFTFFSNDKDGNANAVLDYPVASCTSIGCWEGSGTSYKFHSSGGACTFTLSGNKLDGTCTAFN